MSREAYVFVDIETTGMSAQRGRVIEVAALRYEDGRIMREFRSLVNPGSPIPAPITSLTGITTHDVAKAPAFVDIADQLWSMVEGAIFVAHNVRFDYSFLKQEFARLDRPFTPKQLCTVRLSRALYPDQPRHRLQDLIVHHGLSYHDRHRAYDDAAVLVQFWEKIHRDHNADTIAQAVGRQLRTPSLPRYLDRDMIASLPESPGVYIFRDESGLPLYIGKSVNIRQRVLSHFTRDTAESKEFKISQAIRSIDYEATGTELAALLRESHLVKTHMPIYNRRLRRLRKLAILERHTSPDGYHEIIRRELSPEDLADMSDILAVFERRRGAQAALEQAVTVYDLCAVRCGLEKSRGACFRYQLGKCRGACVGIESTEDYNARVATVFAERSIAAWPYDGAVIISERAAAPPYHGFIVDQWIVRATVTQQAEAEPQYLPYGDTFDHDSYSILRSFLLRHPERLSITPYRGEYDAL